MRTWLRLGNSFLFLYAYTLVSSNIGQSISQSGIREINANLSQPAQPFKCPHFQCEMGDFFQ